MNTEDVTEELKNLSLDGGEDNDLSREEKIAADDTNCSSDSDNQSIISIADTNTSVCSGSSDEFVVIPITAKDENTQEAGIIEVEKLEGRPSETSGDNNNNNNNDEENVTNNIAEIVKKEGSKSGKFKFEPFCFQFKSFAFRICIHNNTWEEICSSKMFFA